VLKAGTRPHADLERTGSALRLNTSRVEGPYRRFLERSNVQSVWLLPLRPPDPTARDRPWMGALALGWRHVPAPPTPPVEGVPVSALWYLVGRRVEEVYTETVLESAAMLGVPTSEGDWPTRIARMAEQLGGDHWVLYRLRRRRDGGLELSLAMETGRFAGRGARLVRYMRERPEELPESSPVRAMMQRRTVFVEDTALAHLQLPPELSVDPVRSAIVMPLGEADDAFGVLSVYWSVPYGWRQFGVSVQPWEAFRRIAAEWWQGMHATRDALHDPLTGVLNRRGLERAWHDMQNRASGGLLGVVDVDHFSEVNNRWGHLMGDAVLRILGQVLTEAAQARGGCCARWGGDEFVVCLPRAEDWARLGAALQEALDARGRAARWPQRVLVSGGAATWQDAGATLEAVFARADRLLYRAKRHGRAQFLLR